MSPSGIQVNKPFVIVVAGLCIGVVVIYRYLYAAPAKSVHIEDVQGGIGKGLQGDGAKGIASFSALEVPADLLKAENPTVEEKMIDVEENGKKYKIKTREAKGKDPKLDVLMLHGQHFTSKTWNDLGTLAFIGKCGCRVVAVDLPGYGESKDAGTYKGRHVTFLTKLIESLHFTRPVIVSPSMSGVFSLPFLFTQPSTADQRCRGFVPVAPLHVNDYAEAYAVSRIPALIIYGQNDGTGKKDSAALHKIPQSQVFEIANASHPAYMHNPKLFHKLMYNFLKYVGSKK